MGTGLVTDHRTRGRQRPNMKVVFLLLLAPLHCWGNSLLRCVSKQGNECQFPFTYRGRTFNQCTTYQSRNGEPWCRTANGGLEDCEGYCPGASCYDETNQISRDNGEDFQMDCSTCSCRAGAIGCTYVGCGGGSAGGSCFNDETGGRFKEDGESWEKDCNTCTCNGGNVACTLIACPPKPPGPCECINPFSGPGKELGDPDTNCSYDPPFCYVDCNSDCYDKEQSDGKCFSTFACNPFVPNSPTGR